MGDLHKLGMAVGEAAAEASWRQWTVLLMAIAIVGLGGYDVLAAWNGADGDTFSEIFRQINRYRWCYSVVFVLWLWLGYHLFCQWSAWQ